MATDSNGILYGTDGYVTVNGTDIGHTIGEIEIELGTEQYYPDLARARGPVKGTGRVVSGASKITVTIAQWQYAILATLFSMGASSDANSEKIGSGSLGTITEIPNIIITGISRNDGKAFRATIPYARVTSPLAAALAPKQEAGLEITFEGLFTDAAPSTMPGWVEFAK